MGSFDAELRNRLNTLREQGLLRELRRVDSPQGVHINIAKQELLNFSSNDYLGLANHPALKEAAAKATKDFGTGAGASRLICGSLAPFHELEESLAEFKGTEAALTFSTGYAAAIGTITALLGKDDIIIVDKLVHACVVDAARLSGAKLRVFAHNDLNNLEAKLKWTTDAFGTATNPSRILIVTESIFSMDGDAAPLVEIVSLKEKYGAWLMVDEAHATGLYGPNRRGLAEKLGVSDRIEIQMGTLGKALGASGGYICGDRSLIDYLINRARSLIFSTAPVPAAAAAARAAVQLVQSCEGSERNAKVWDLVNLFEDSADSAAIALAASDSLIKRVILGEAERAVATAVRLREQGFFVPAIRYPTVARNSARLRITLTADHTVEHIDAFVRALSALVANPS